MKVNIPDEILIEIIHFFDIHDNYIFCTVCKSYLKLGRSNCLRLIKDKKEFVSKWFPDIICKIMHGISTLIFAPLLPFKDNFIGIDYIDEIKINDVWSPIMIGIDKCNRPFITIRIIDKKPSVTTIFQRYTNDKDTWTFGSHYYSRLLGDNPSCISTKGVSKCKIFEENIKNLLNENGYIKYSDYINKDKYHFIKACLY